MARPQRIPDYSYVGVQRYFLTLCTYERAAHFADAAVVTMMLGHFMQRATVHGVLLIAYCVMPDHVHLLVDGGDDGAELRPFVKLAKQQSGYAFKQVRRTRLWQAGYYEHVVRDEERTEDIVFYIIANPVRKGLVTGVVDYPFWGSGIYSREELLASIGIGYGA